MKKRRNGEGSLFYNNTLKRWQGQYKGKTIYQNLKENESEKDFARRFAKFKVSIDDDTFIEKNTVVLKDIIENYINQKYKDGKTSSRSYQRDKETLQCLEKCCPKLIKKEIQKITISDIEKEKINMRDYSQSSIQKMWAFLRKSFSLSYSRRLINFNIMEAGIEQPISKKQKKEHKALTLAEEIALRELLKNERSDYAKIALVQLETGMRAGEILARTFDDYDANQKTLHVHNSLTLKGNKPVIGDHTKTYSKIRNLDLGERTIPISNECAKIFNRIKKSTRTNIYNLIFYNYDKNQFYTVGSYNSYLRRLNEKYNISKDFTTHTLRRTRITRMQEKHIPLVVIQYSVGHVSGSSITNDVYTTVSMDFLKQELNK